jgi:hypothetical protein
MLMFPAMHASDPIRQRRPSHDRTSSVTFSMRQCEPHRHRNCRSGAAKLRILASATQENDGVFGWLFGNPAAWIGRIPE